ncbi:hypothetical protein SPSIL_051990 [Sporomusa silvacetica DSM 10669]|uniref:Uroporphyrinogen decarboxylase (URO-D) domain-containing protein n=1 Tax=Sporomusa silvacetica DSM 10669 TaxID=1123289 RepID=A0ABZ3ITV0_9FIRM|nr:uroporphyrinogen decarboxylase family protein [Sporomusa silvacetica]OZC22306.1 methylcobalamin:coenzyme M methyltransferase [Sporomusa silvacetica DSM 10669]
MGKDSMTAEERIVAAINLQPVDRIVCAPIIEQYAGQFAGLTNKEYMTDWDKAMAAVQKVWETYPVWDCNSWMLCGRFASVAHKCGPGQMRLPGEGLDDNAQYQIIEFEAMNREDYAIIKEQSFDEYRLTFLERCHKTSREEVLAGLKESARLRADEIARTLARGQSSCYGFIIGTFPFEAFSIMRSLEKFYKDMFQMGGELEEVLTKATKDLLASAIPAIKATGVNRVFVGGVRGCGQFISLKHFERFVWPNLKYFLTTLIENDIVPILHYDGDWTKNLEYFLELPKGKFVLELDSATDMFKAHDILKDHCAIMGDVSASLFTVASPSELDEYAKKLITTFRKSGASLIYSSGCNVPINAKHENVKAFFDAVEKYGRFD